MKFAVGIPSYNEAKNIGSLTRLIDQCAQELGWQLTIINADNSSPDGTANIFNSQPTKNAKVSLATDHPGKGRNLQEILRYVAAEKIDYCMLIDADVTSVDVEWFRAHLEKAQQGVDYTVPVYARYWIEGNTTNHFVYPLFYHWTNGRTPRQPIAGDFGISLKLAEYLIEQEWREADMQYGVDVLMTVHALSGGFRVREIALDRKIHAPSFEKAATIFTGEAESYFNLRSKVSMTDSVDFVGLTKVAPLLDGLKISKAAQLSRKAEAEKLFAAHNLLPTYEQLPNLLDAQEWAKILVAHEQLLDSHSAQEIAESLCPYFLRRMSAYLRACEDSAEAEGVIAKQCRIIDNLYSANKL